MAVRRKSLLHDGHDVVLAHDENFFAVDFDGLTGIFAKKYFVADFHIQRTDFAVFQYLAVTNGEDFALIRLLGSGFWQDDARGGFGFMLETLDDNAVVQRTKAHKYS